MRVSSKMIPVKLKIQISLLAGLIYWGTVYILIKIGHPSLEKILPILIFDILPFVFGLGLVTLIRGRTIWDILHCSIIVLVYYLIDLFRNYLLLPEPYNPLAMTWRMFHSVGSISVILSVIGGAISVVINRKFLNKAVKIKQAKA
jgi:hypothetical protein